MYPVMKKFCVQNNTACLESFLTETLFKDKNAPMKPLGSRFSVLSTHPMSCKAEFIFF